MSDVRQLKNKRPPLFTAVKNDILQNAKNNQYPDGKLPSEEELCGIYGVSRATVREALGILHREGFISKRHGTGNIINRSVVNTVMRFDLDINLPHVLRQSGCDVRLKREQLKQISSQDDLFLLPCAETKLPYKAEQITRHKIGNELAVLAQNLFPVFRTGSCSEYQNFKDFVQIMTGFELSHSIKTLIPVLLSEKLKKEFGCGEPCGIVWYEQHYSVDDKLICESFVYFNPKLDKLCSVSRW